MIQELSHIPDAEAATHRGPSMKDPGKGVDDAKRIWTFNPPYPEVYPAVSPKVIVVGAEPNDKGADQLPCRDMGVALRMQLSNVHGEYYPYHQEALRQMRAVLSDGARQSDEDVLKHLRYVDLKATGGTGKAATAEIRSWVRAHVAQVIGYWLNDRPEYTILQGGHAQIVFEEIVVPELRKRNVEGLKVGLPHPSKQNKGSFNDPTYAAALTQVRQQLRRIGEPLRYWAPRAKEWRTR